MPIITWPELVTNRSNTTERRTRTAQTISMSQFLEITARMEILIPAHTLAVWNYGQKLTPNC